MSRTEVLAPPIICLGLMYPLMSAVYIWTPTHFWGKGPPHKNYRHLFYYFAEKPWLPMADIIVVGCGNSVRLFQRKAIIDLARANDHSVTALLSLHIQQFTYLLERPVRASHGS